MLTIKKMSDKLQYRYLFLTVGAKTKQKITSFLLCHHSLFAHQTVRAMPLLRLRSAAHADEASLSHFLL